MNKRFILVIGLISLLAGCSLRGTAALPEPVAGAVPYAHESPVKGEGASSSTQVSSEQWASQQATIGQSDVDPQTSLNRMVIYNASLSLIVQDTSQAIATVRKIIQDAGGYIAASNTYREEEQLRATMTVRVPSDKLVATLDQLKKIALSVESEGLKGDDVTDQYTDLQSRLRNLQVAEEQYLAILKRADKIEDVLAVQQRLDQVRGEIEQVKGRMDYLSKSAALATITITLIPDALARPISIGGWRPHGTARDALDALLWALRALGDAIIWALICVLPMALILGVPSYFALRFAIRRWRKPRR